MNAIDTDLDFLYRCTICRTVIPECDRAAITASIQQRYSGKMSKFLTMFGKAMRCAHCRVGE